MSAKGIDHGSAILFYQRLENKRENALTAEKQPKCPPAHLTLDEIEAFVRRLLVHPQGHGNMRRFTKGRMLSSVMAFAEVVDTVATIE